MAVGALIAAAILSSADGGAWEADVFAVLDVNEELLRCAAAPLRGLPTIEVHVEADGSVGVGGVASDTVPPTASCVLEVVRGLTLPAPGSPRTLRYTWAHAGDVRWRQLRPTPLSAWEVQTFLWANAEAFERCARGPPMKLTLSVEADGGVSSLRAGRKDAPTCVATVLGDLAFPRGRAPVQLSVTIPAPRLKPAPVAAGERGALSWRELRLAQALDRRGVAGCYVTQRGPHHPEGRFEVQVLVAPTGRVLVARAEPSAGALAGTDVGACVAERVRGWWFPPTKGLTSAVLTWVAAAEAERVALFAPAGPTPFDAVTVVDSVVAPATPGPTVGLRAFAAELEACSASTDPAPDGGVLTLDWRPQADGTVRDPRSVGSPALPKALVDCALTRLRGFRFEASSAALPHRTFQAFAFTSRGVALSKDAAEGGLDKDEIMAVIRAHELEVKYCYERELQQQPALAGMVSVAWTIGPDGRVLPSVRTDHDEALDATARCITERVLVWPFPEPGNGGVVNVTFPWMFKPAGVD